MRVGYCAAAALAAAWLAASPVAGANSETGGYKLLGEDLPAGTWTRRHFSPTESLLGIDAHTPVEIVTGGRAGPVVCVFAGIHGDELSGLAVIRELMQRIVPADLKGTLVALPIANVPAFRRSSRYLPDRRDLNRHFPGDPKGSLAARLAHALFEQIARGCAQIIDIHTGSLQRTNLPYAKADLDRPAVRALALSLGLPVIHHAGRPGTLRRAATDAGIAAVVLEMGEALRFDEGQIKVGVEALERALEVTPSAPAEGPSVYRRSRWVRAERGGIFLRRTAIGDYRCRGEPLGLVIDPLGDSESTVTVPISGVVIGLAFNQVVMPGFALANLAFDAERGDEPRCSAQESP